MQVLPGWSQALMADGSVQGASWRLGNSHPPLGASGWQRVPLSVGGGASKSVGRGGRGSSDAAGEVWEVSVSGICLPACLPLCCSEGGRGWACSCLGRAAPAWDTALLSGYRLTASLPTHLDSQRGASGQARMSEKIVEVSFSRQSSQPSGRCSGTGPGGGQPLEGCGELRLGVSWAAMHPRSLHPKLQGGGEGSGAQGSPSPGLVSSR